MFLSFLNRIIRGHLTWIGQAATRSPRIVTAIFLLMLILSLVSLSRVHFETDIFKLFPAKKPALGLFVDSLEWTGSAKEAYFLLEGDKGRLPDEAELFAEKLRALKVDGAPAFNRVRYRIFEQSESESFNRFVAFAASHPAAFVPSERLPDLLERISPDGQSKAVARIPEQLGGLFGGGAAALAVADPLSLRDFFLPRLKTGSQALDLDPESPYFLSRDGKVLIMIAEPARPVQEMAFARKLVAGINDARKGAGVRISCAGAHISAVIDEAAMKSNILACIISSLIVVLGIFYAVYRRLLPTLMIPVILGVGVMLALGIYAVFSTDIHIISFAFMALIIGLGTDYSIHLYDRFHTERAAGAELGEAVDLAVTDTGHGLFTAAFTTALPFMALGFSEVRALAELGLLVGLGVLCSLYATLFFMPPVLIYADRFVKIYRPLPSLLLDRLWDFTCRHAKLLITVSCLLFMVFSGYSLAIRFDSDIRNLQPKNSEAFIAIDLVERHLNLAPRQLLVAVDGADEAVLHQRLAQIEKYAERLASEKKVAAWSSVGRVLNRQPEQQLITGRLNSAIDKDVISGQLEKTLKKHGLDAEQFEQYIKSIKAGSLVSPVDEQQAISRLLDSPLKGVIDRHIVKDSSGWHGLVYLFHNDNSLDPVTFASELKRIDPAARVTGPALVSTELLDLVKKSIFFGFAVGGVVVFMLLLMHFRDYYGIVSTMGPVIAGGAAMLGIMAMVGMKLNFMNALVLVTIVGMGSDYGLHLQHRIAGLSGESARINYVQSARAVLLSAVTTIAGFGSLAFTDYSAMSSIGWATNLGIGFTAIAALVILPAAIHVVSNIKRGSK